MYSLYKRSEVNFAIVWIVIYCLVSIPIRGNFGDDSIFMLIALIFIALGISFFIKKYGLEEKYGLNFWPKNSKRYLDFIPIWILATGNLWGGINLSNRGLSQIFAVLSMILIGYIEEIIFRGFLFKGILPKDGVKKSIFIVAITFGIGHIINLFAGQTNLETIAQVFFAIGWGFMLTCIFYKSKSLLPCILAHSLIDALSKFSYDNPISDWIYIVATIVIAYLYCSYLLKLPEENTR